MIETMPTCRRRKPTTHIAWSTFVLAAGAIMLCGNGCGSSQPAVDTASNNHAPAESEASTDSFWQGLERHEIQLEQTLLVVKGSRGVVACPYLNVETFTKTGEACAIVPAKNIDGMPDSRVTAVTPAAEALGITVGMSGRDALEKIR